MKTALHCNRLSNPMVALAGACLLLCGFPAGGREFGHFAALAVGHSRQDVQQVFAHRKFGIKIRYQVILFLSRRASDLWRLFRDHLPLRNFAKQLRKKNFAAIVRSQATRSLCRALGRFPPISALRNIHISQGISQLAAIQA